MHVYKIWVGTGMGANLGHVSVRDCPCLPVHAMNELVIRLCSFDRDLQFCSLEWHG